MGDGPDWAAAVQAFTALVALGLGWRAVWMEGKSKKEHNRNALQTLQRIHHLAIVLIRRIDSYRSGDGMLNSHHAKYLLFGGDVAELMASLNDVRGSDLP